ncbi:MAG: VIT1/CCC1 transporter family protein [Acidimicrobiales bacterium]
MSSPLERIAEVLFGLVMALTFTGTLSVATAGREDVHTMLLGALGCNLAWGIIDAVGYLLGTLAERGRGLTMLRLVRGATDGAQARTLIADALSPVVASVFRPADFEYVRGRLATLPEPPRLSLTLRDLRGAVAVFLLVVLATLPVALPFVFIPETRLALRVSNAVALVMLFLGGYRLGRYMGRSPLRVGFLTTVIGVVLVAITIALGG